MDKTVARASACAACLGTLTPGRITCKMLFLVPLDKFDLVTFRSVNEGNSATVR
jgi:hypothetical protein